MKPTLTALLLRSFLVVATSVSFSVTALHADASKQPPVASSEEKQHLLEDLIDKLMGCGLTRADATALARRIVDGDAEAVQTARRIEDAVADLHRVNADDATIARVAKEIFERRLTDGSRGGAAQSVTGRAVIEVVLGKDAVKKLPAFAGNRTGEISRALLNAMAELDLVGVPHNTKEYQSVLDTIVSKGLEGRDALAAVRVVTDPFVKAAESGNPPPETTPISPDPSGGEKSPAPEIILVDPVKTNPPPASSTGGNKEADTSTTPASPATGGRKGGSAPASGTSGSGTPASSSSGSTTKNPASPGTSGSSGVGGQFSETESYNADGNLVITTTDATGKVVQTITVIEMTNGVYFVVKDGNGNVIPGLSEFMPAIGVTPGDKGADASRTNPNNSTDAGGSNTRDRSTGGGRTNDASGGSSDDSGNNKDDDGSSAGTPDDPTLTPEEREAAQERRDSENSAETAIATPLHPDFRNDGGTGFGLYTASGGRLGGQDARNALAALYHRKSGKGGTVDPSPDAARRSGVLLTPEEKKNVARALGMAKGGGVTDPASTDKPKTVVTTRDIKDLSTRGTGGAKGPATGEKPATPPKPQDPKSPVTPPKPKSVPGAARAVDSSKIAPAVNEQIKTEAKAQGATK